MTAPMQSNKRRAHALEYARKTCRANHDSMCMHGKVKVSLNKEDPSQSRFVEHMSCSYRAKSVTSHGRKSKGGSLSTKKSCA